MKYDFEVGDRVKYQKLVHREEKCGSCGHIEDVYDSVPAEGAITARKAEVMINVANGFVTDEQSFDETGQLIYKPYMADAPAAALEPIAVYQIDGEGWTAGVLQKI